MNMVKIKIKEKMSTIILKKGELNNSSFRFVICTGEVEKGNGKQKICSIQGSNLGPSAC